MTQKDLFMIIDEYMIRSARICATTHHDTCKKHQPCVHSHHSWTICGILWCDGTMNLWYRRLKATEKKKIFVRMEGMNTTKDITSLRSYVYFFVPPIILTRCKIITEMIEGVSTIEIVGATREYTEVLINPNTKKWYMV